MFRTVDRYLLREIAESWLAVTAVLSLILVGNSVIFIFREVTSGDIPADSVAPFMLTNLVLFMVGIIPFSLYLGVLIGLGRLYKDSEMAALAACGIGGARLYRPVLLLCVPAVLAVLFLTFVASPWAARIEQVAKTEIAARSELSGIRAGRFNESRDGKTVLFVAELSAQRSSMENVFLHAPDPGGGRALETARSATREQRGTERYIVLHDGRRYVGEPGAGDYQIIEFGRHGVRIPEPRGQTAYLRSVGRTLGELLASGHLVDRAELQWRLALASAALLLALIAVPLSHTTPRKGRYARLALAMLVYLPYWNLLVAAKSWMKAGVTPAWMGIWWAHLPLLVLLGVLVWRRAGGSLPRRAVRA